MFRTVGQQLSISAEKYKDREAVVFCENNERFTFSQIKYEVIIIHPAGFPLF